MHKKKNEIEEHLEKLWEMKEFGQAGINDLRLALNGDFEADLISEMAREGLVDVAGESRKITLTAKGEILARKVIRAHRIGERLLYDVFGGDFEAGACEFEHMSNLGIVDGICTLLGHPKQCPHGKPIPEGECCRYVANTAQSLVVPLREMKIGQSARVAYINCKDDGQMHRLSGLQIRPGVMIKLHQWYPCSVVECEGASIAIDEEIAANICVWYNAPQLQPTGKKLRTVEKKRDNWWNRNIGIGNKKGCGSAD